MQPSILLSSMSYEVKTAALCLKICCRVHAYVDGWEENFIKMCGQWRSFLFTIYYNFRAKYIDHFNNQASFNSCINLIGLDARMRARYFEHSILNLHFLHTKWNTIYPIFSLYLTQLMLFGISCIKNFINISYIETIKIPQYRFQSRMQL